MFICAAGDIHGAIDQLYLDVLAFEDLLGARFDYVLHVGDFGVWPDPERVDKATRNHEGAGDFPTWFSEHRAAPRPTVFIKGNHEDFVWLEGQNAGDQSEILSGLTYLPNGETIDLAVGGETIRVGGIGGCHGPWNYGRRSRDLQGGAKRHFTHDEVERVRQQPGIDVLLLHDAPAGVEFTWRREDGPVRRSYKSKAEGLARVVAETQPKLCFFGHHHTRLDAEIEGVRCIGLNKVGRPGNLIAVEFMSHGECQIVAEWPLAADTLSAVRPRPSPMSSMMGTKRRIIRA